jgi:hypothetical protein
VLETGKERIAKDLTEYSQSLARSGTPDCPVVHRTASGAPGQPPVNRPLGKVWRRTAINHRTVRWCTGLSGEPTAASATVGCAIHGRRVARANGRQGAPDSVRCAICHESATVVCARIGRRSRTRHEQWLSGGAPDYPVCHPTERKDSLPCWPPTAPSCLGATQAFKKRSKTSRLQLRAFDSLR